MVPEVKNPPANAGGARDTGLIPGLGRSPAIGNGSLLQYSCLGDPMDRGAWGATVHGVTRSRTQLSDWTHTHTLSLSHMLVSGQAGIQTKLFSSRSRTLNDYKPYCLQTHGSKLLPVREPLKSRDFIPHRHWDPCIPGCHGQNWVTPPTFVCWSHNPQGHCI